MAARPGLAWQCISGELAEAEKVEEGPLDLLVFLETLPPSAAYKPGERLEKRPETPYRTLKDTWVSALVPWEARGHS